MKSRLPAILLTISVLASLTLSTQLVGAEPRALPPSLSFRADIYGGSSLETIEYLSDLKFHSWGGFGTNAHVYRARLQSSGEEIAYAISADTNPAFSFDLVSQTGSHLTLNLADSEYSQGSVEALSPDELHFSWNIEQSGVHIRLHRYARLDRDERVTVRNVLYERFVIENLGPTVWPLSFSEYLHMDDRARVRDYSNDGRDETLLAINSYTTNGYPVFGKVYLSQEGIDATLISDGRFATVTHNMFGQLRTSNSQIMTEAAFISSTARNDLEAEAQVARDAAILLGLGYRPDQWLVRTYNSDDAGAVFVNGLMVAGSRYSSYPDSGWWSVNKYWRQQADNSVTFAGYDLGVSGSAKWGFSIRRNEDTLWNVQGSGPASQGISYQHILRASQTGEVADYSQPLPSPTLDGHWYAQVRANGGVGFALVDNLPVAGSSHGQAQWVEITDKLGQFDNHIHLNAWDHGEGTFDWYFAIRLEDQIVWESQSQVVNGPRGTAQHFELTIDSDGNVYPKLDYPVDYPDKARGIISRFRDVFSVRTYSLFDHKYPTYGAGDDILWPFTGDPRPDPPDVECRGGYNCYDQHDGYDIRRFCPEPVRCPNPLFIYPAADGTIIEAETGWIDNALGCQIAIDHGGQWKTIYAHLFGPEEDQDCGGILRYSGTVTRFTRIAIMGCSGSGCRNQPDNTHLHFAVEHSDRVVDPSGWDRTDLTDFWAEHVNGAVSFPQWLYPPNVQQTVDPASGGQLGSLANGIQAIIATGYYSEPLTFSLSTVPAPEASDQLAPSGISFSLIATDDSGTSVGQLYEPMEIRVSFAADNVAHLKPDSLALYSWDAGKADWVPETTTVDLTNLTAMAYVDHLSLFALLGEPIERIYLPIVARAR